MVDYWLLPIAVIDSIPFLPGGDSFLEEVIFNVALVSIAVFFSMELLKDILLEFCSVKNSSYSLAN